MANIRPRNTIADLNLDELKAAAPDFAVDIDGLTKKADIVKEFEDMGVTLEMYNALFQPKEEDPVELAVLDDTPLDQTGVEPAPAEDEESQYLIKMTRKNHSLQIRGYKFSQQNPYALVSEADADYLVEHGGGFRVASPKELKEFYGQV